MNGILAKKINSRPQNWISLINFVENRSKQKVRLPYTNLYAYGANNPIYYTDPDGRKVENNRKEYILIKTEKRGFVVFPAKSIYTGKGVVDGISGKRLDQIDSGKIDGIIFSSGDVIKISDDLKLPWNVDVTLTDKSISIGDFNIELVGYCSNFKSLAGNFLCNIIKLFTLRTDLSGVKDISEICWLSRSLSQSELDELSKSKNGTFYSKDYLEEKIKEWDEKK